MNPTNPTTIRLFVTHEQLVGYAARTIDRRVNTIDLFRRHLELHGVEHIDRDAVESFMVARASQQTRASYLSDLRRFYAWAVDRGYAADDPTEGVSTPRVPMRAPTPLDIGDVRATLAACVCRQDRLVVKLGLFAGLRVSEIADLAPRDIRWRDGLISVRGKGSKIRRVPIAPQLVADLEGPTLVEAVTRSGVSRRIGVVFDRADVTARPHDLRHTFATELAKVTDGNVVLVSQLLGHESVKTTMRYVGWHPDGGESMEELYAA